MSKLDELAGSSLRDALDASSQNRRRDAKQRNADNAQSQVDRLEAGIERAAEVEANAAHVRQWLQHSGEARIIQATADAEYRATSQAALQLETSRKLEEYAAERMVGAVERAFKRSTERQRNAEQTHVLLEAAAKQRGLVRADLEGFRKQLHRASTGAMRLEAPEQARAVPKRLVTRATPIKASVVKQINYQVGAMQSPDPMTAIARRRENMIIKMIAANPGVAGEHLEKNLYMDKIELQTMLKRLTTIGFLRQENGAYWLLPRAEL